MMDFPSGPALDEEEAQRLAVLMRDNNWTYLDALLKRMWQAADANLNNQDDHKRPQGNARKDRKAIIRKSKTDGGLGT